MDLPARTQMTPFSATGPYSSAEADAYRKGYEEATLLHTASAALSAAQKPRYRSIIPAQAADFAFDYPLVTTAAIGAFGAGSMWCGARAAGWAIRRFFPRPISPVPSVMRDDIARLGKLEASLAGEMERYDATFRDVKAGLGPLNGQLSRIVNQNKMIIQSLELLGKSDRPTKDFGGVAAVSGANQVGTGVRKEAQGKQEAMDSVIAAFKDGVETRLRDLEDHVVMANKDRRTELQRFRNELMGQLKMIEDQVGSVGTTSEVSIGHVHAAISGLSRRLRESASLPRATIHSVPPSATVIDAPPGAPETVRREPAVTREMAMPAPQPCPEDATEAIESRRALYDNIAATKDKYQAIMDASPNGSASTTDGTATDISEAEAELKKSKAWQRKSKRKTPDQSQVMVDPDVEAEASQDESEPVEHTAGLDMPGKDLQTVLNSLPQHTKSHQERAPATPDTARTAAADAAAEQPESTAAESEQTASQPNTGNGRSRTPVPTQSTSASTGPAHRLGVDDSGNWRIIVHSGRGQEASVAGWRIADVIYETRSSSNCFGPFFAFASMSSGQEVYSDINIFMYPEFDIVRLDGQLWRCEKQGQGLWVIREKLGDMTLPEWDGVGYEKE